LFEPLNGAIGFTIFGWASTLAVESRLLEPINRVAEKGDRTEDDGKDPGSFGAAHP
jgi:hypothetical protein